jgi:WD40 repeat protein
MGVYADRNRTGGAVAEGSSGQPLGLLAQLAPGSRVAGYRLEDRIGAGGMAVVFRARDERLGRLVALKMLAPALAADAKFRERFIRESRAAAAVDHPHIIPVHEAGEADDVLYIAMRFVAGGDLSSVVEREGPLPPGRAADLISPVASALDAAHGAGLVHRDVKPANVLVDASPGGADHVYLSDFGLTKGELSAASLTGTGQFLGTPDYSAPEQISGRAVDRRTDQYALACVAFKLLTGRVPFERDEPMAVLYAHLSAPPPLLTVPRPDLPRPAAEVLARALAKDPEARFGGCGEFADALREALGVTPYGAHVAGQQRTRTVGADRQRTWDSPPSRIAPADRAGPTVSQPAAVPAAGATPPFPARRQRGRRIAVAVTGLALVVAAAVTATTLANSGAHGTPPTSPKHTGTARHGGAGQANAADRNTTITLGGTLTDPSGDVTSLAFTPDGKSLVTTDGSGVLYLWDIATGTNTPLTYIHDNGVDTATISPNGQTVAAVAHDSTSVYLWNAMTRGYVTTLTNPGYYYASSVAFSPDSKLLAIGDFHGGAYLWDVATGREIAPLTSPRSGQNPVWVAFTPDGKTLAVANTDSTGGTLLWNLARHTVTAILTDPEGSGVNSVAFSPDGKLLAAGDNNGTTYLWDVATRTVLAPLTGLGPTESVVSVAFSRDGLLAVGDANGRIYVWDAATRHLITTLNDPAGRPVLAVAFSPDGKLLATADDEGGIALWRVNS